MQGLYLVDDDSYAIDNTDDKEAPISIVLTVVIPILAYKNHDALYLSTYGSANLDGYLIRLLISRNNRFI